MLYILKVYYVDYLSKSYINNRCLQFRGLHTYSLCRLRRPRVLHCRPLEVYLSFWCVIVAPS